MTYTQTMTDVAYDCLSKRKREVEFVKLWTEVAKSMVVDAPWTTPVGILGFLASGGKWQGAVAQLLCFATSILVYSPFVIASNRQIPTEEAAA